ncbi:MAG TPA: transcription-repair coupling factor [Spirochaetia bacterium]|nr:transcription-repair coupling factor [Spirochaetia bacterium]
MANLFRKQLDSHFDRSRALASLLAASPRRGEPLRVRGPRGAYLSFVIERISSGAASLVVTPTEREAEAIVQDIESLGAGRVVLFPWWGTAAYEGTSPLASIFGDRVSSLWRLASGEKLIVVAPLRALLTPVPDPRYLSALTLSVRRGQKLDPQETAARLSRSGYLRVPTVTIHGELAIRGEVIDVYVPGRDQAVRLTLDFDTVSDIRTFDPLDQSSTGKLEMVDIVPCREVVLGDDERASLAAALKEQGFSAKEVEETVSRLLEDPEAGGVELFYPLCLPSASSLMDYLDPADVPGGRAGVVCLVDEERLRSGSAALRKEYLELFRRARAKKLVVPGPQRVLLDFADLLSRAPRSIDFSNLPPASGTEQSFFLPSDEPRSFFGNFTFFREEIEAALKNGYTVFIFAVYEVQAERLRHILKDLPVTILPQAISAGFTLPEQKLLVIQEGEIFGRKRRIPRSVGTAKSSAIESFVELSPGDFVVHVNHGIGMFNGIERIRAAANERDYITLEYADGERLFIPIEQVNLIQRYIGQEGRQPRLDSLGGRGWQRRKEKAKKAVEELAQGLLELYSRRKAEPGFAFPSDTDWQSEFEAAFPYEETEDQLRCIEDVKRDMEAPVAMDRLVCGDVGYGKTEIALRAAFKAMMGGKQVALLAPTTILVEQHYDTFRERFARFPAKLAMLSRFRTRAELSGAITDIAAGRIDIAIGTHRLIQKDVKFRNLGLLIVDEEQRFGVKHKERLKQIKSSVDCLTLTATPIPRTLNMSLMKVRDMSILNTAPQNRLPIETYVTEFNEELVARAVREEIARGGQVYYLHNRIETIGEIHLFLQRLVPEVSIAIGHGQMDEDELEEVMRSFVHGERQLLLSTTIIENGLDIPNVNTIIIDRADMLGIAQLYQLRGRVGRAGIPAYAYLLYPDRRSLSEVAMKRLRIISDNTELGSGFRIALKDLEIRGAGNILGREQHGYILSVGYDLYLKMLDEAVAALSKSDRQEAPEVYMDLEYSGFIPDSYIPDAMEKMEVYKKIAGISTDDEFDKVYREIEDRFGPVPDEVHSVLALAEIRVICGKLFITSIREEKGELSIEFSRLSRISVDRVVRMVKESAGRITLDPKRPNFLIMRTGAIGLREKSEFIRERLSLLT